MWVLPSGGWDVLWGGAYASPSSREIMSDACSGGSTGRIRNAARGCQSITPPARQSTEGSFQYTWLSCWNFHRFKISEGQYKVLLLVMPKSQH